MGSCCSAASTVSAISPCSARASGSPLRLGHVRQRLVAGAAVAVGDLPAQLGVARVDDDPVEPGPDARHGRERVAEAPGAQVGVLHGLLGVGPVAQDQAGGAEGGDVALLEPVCELVLHHPPFMTQRRPDRFDSGARGA